jgi:histidyl-tRNA synthetase
MHCGSGSFKSQFKKADKSGADYALILADEEVLSNKVSIKFLRTDEEQRMVSIFNLLAILSTDSNLLASSAVNNCSYNDDA